MSLLLDICADSYNRRTDLDTPRIHAPITSTSSSPAYLPPASAPSAGKMSLASSVPERSIEAKRMIADRTSALNPSKLVDSRLFEDFRKVWPLAKSKLLSQNTEFLTEKLLGNVLTESGLLLSPQDIHSLHVYLLYSVALVSQDSTQRRAGLDLSQNLPISNLTSVIDSLFSKNRVNS